jgi:flagellar hook protein FlgE
MSFQQGLSGLSAASKSLDVTGNNIANSNTVGFKESRAEFADMFANSLNSSGSSNVGIGTSVSTVQQMFSQGNITTTSNSLDIAINGNGFYRMDTNGTVSYTRAGQFELDKNGYITNAAGSVLTGYVANSSGVLATGSPTDLQINTANIPASATTTINSVINLNATDSAIATAFNPTDSTTYNNSTSATVYDSLGNSHTLTNFFVKSATAGTWNVYTTIDGSSTPVSATPTPLTFSTSGAATGSTTQTVAFTPAGAAAVSVNINYAGSTQFGSAFSVNSLSQNGYTSGQLTGFSTGADGTIVGNYSNGQTQVLGQVVLTSFANPNGLQNLGGNSWAQTASSGQAVVGAPGSGNLGVLQSNATEDSNVDLTAELVNLITAQRFYQANAQTIKTEDQIQQTLVNLA